MLLSVHGASFRPVAQARNRVSSLCSPPFPPPAPPSAEPIGSIFQTHVEPALLSAEPQPLCPGSLPWLPCGLRGSPHPSPVCSANTRPSWLNASQGCSVLSCPTPSPGPFPLLHNFPHPWPIATPQSLSTAHPPVGTKCEAGPVVWTSVWCCASGHSPWRPSGRRRPGGQDRLPGVGAPPCCPSNLRPLQGCLRAVQGAECTGP